MARDVKVEVRGVRELQGAFKKVDVELVKELKVGFKAIAEDIASDARGKVPQLTGKAASSIKSRGTAKGASIAFGGSVAPYYPWLDFGGAVGRNDSVKRDFIIEGRYVYPSIREHRDEIIDGTDKLLARVAASAGFETRGDGG